LHPFVAGRLVLPLMYALRGEAVARGRRLLELSQWEPLEQIERRQLTRLNAVVAAARRRHPSYDALLADHDVSRPLRALSELARLPLLEKDDLRRYALNVPRGRAGTWRTGVRVTGGSTGAPAMVLVDPGASAMSLAARELCQAWHGIVPGDRQARFWGRPPRAGFKRERAKDALLNRLRMDSLALEPALSTGALRRVAAFAPAYVYGYASLLQLLADLVTSAGGPARVGLRLKAAISTSETLPRHQQEAMAVALGAPVVIEYGCSETDIIAFQCPRGGQHIVAENIIVEVLRLGDEPDGLGQIVITDLHNELMPLVRYRLGDLAPLAAPTCGCGRNWPCLGPVVGRAQGQYINVPGRGRVHSQSVVYLIEELVTAGYPIGRFKIVQEGEFALTVLLTETQNGRLAVDEVRDYLIEHAQDALGPQMTWRVAVVEAAKLAAADGRKFCHFESRLS
jgi:phenylacetate-CoA ligase